MSEETKSFLFLFGGVVAIVVITLAIAKLLGKI